MTTSLSLPTSPEVREQLTKAEWRLYEGFLPMEQWEKNGHWVTWNPDKVPVIQSIHGWVSFELASEFTALAGVPQTPSPGMVLVPAESVANAARSLLDAADLVQGKRPMFADLWRSHAAALTPIHEPGAPSKGDGD